MSVGGLLAGGILGAMKLTSLRRRVRAVEREALTDPLTGLYNRRGCERRLAEDLARKSRRQAESFSLVVADLDNLKQVNDRYGHSAGDQYLREFARLLKDNLRAGDWVGRWAGDEFLVALWDTGSFAGAASETAFKMSGAQDDVRGVLHRLLAQVSQTVVRLPGGAEPLLSASFGVANCGDVSREGNCPADSGVAELVHHDTQAGGPFDDDLTLFERADAALLEAKRRGKGMIVHA